MSRHITMFRLNIHVQTDMPEQIVQTQIKLLLKGLKEQFDQGLHCFPFYYI